MVDFYQIIVLTFIVTALWDVGLRYLSLNFDKTPNIVKNTLPFMKDLKPYFQNTHC